MSNHLSRRTMLALSAAAPFGVLVPTALAQDPIPPPPHTDAPADRMAMVGIARGQFARLSVFHHPDQSVVPCGFVGILIGMDGKPVATGQGVVMPGKGAFVDFDLGEQLRRGERLQVHCNVEVPQGHEHQVGATLEIYDAQSGETTMSITPCGVHAPLLEMGTVGIVRGQIARLSLFHHNDGTVIPCGYRADIYGLDGTLLATNKGALTPGKGVFFDYDLAAGADNRQRVQFHAMVSVPPGHDLGMFVEGFDAQTGVSAWVIVPCGVEDPTLQ